ncbi:putative oxidoreductase [Dyadobacter sp. BE34]|uniref:Oxidoreductase n=1 Tax=Dyadobacter fermentans TaxID=94254 RepID=A0ABU1QPF3_9BACT|nr:MULTISPECIES: aldo/keto reductase [Dyadobacter]MBZ1358389.1 aldo/keto reductase [Dyadobacter fermentans]MDR6803037.1 putative oxidoreductase [Dyadobacter fermentans]MDR7040779.1 putative oxidoreductase [Dyadobacter sp. BE242]MDR7195181.1 putative oxidoreductase [Dyadobacter sp. BE34]MDR7214274.1 putative oxidoreductase [Dyadobacter sp. BE31]
MKKVSLSDSGPKVSEAIYGFWRWTDEGAVTTTQIEKTVNLCLDLGINTFDHADVYGDHTIEEHFGKIIANKSFKREDIVLFSKCGIRTSADKYLTYYDNSREHIINSINGSLKRLKTDYLDIFLLHQSDLLADPEETAMALAEIVTSGKAKHIGVANFTVFQHQLLASYLRIPIVTNHIELNLMNTTAIEDGRIDFIKQSFSKPLAWAPLAGGKILNGTDEKAVRLRAKLDEVGKKYDANIEQTAVAWLMKLGTLPIIGSLSEARIRNGASASDIKLSREDWYDIYQVVGK